MSLIVAIKDKDRIVLGSDKQASTGMTKSHDCTKIWEVEGLTGAIMGGVGSMRVNQLIQYNKIIDLNDVSINGIDTAFVVNSLVPVITNLLNIAGIKGVMEDEKTNTCPLMPNVFLFAYEDRAWMIWNDLSVTELADYLAIGSGSDVANGALYATPDKNPFERIVTSIDAAAETTLFVDDGVDLLATKYYDKDQRLILKALSCDKLEVAAQEATNDHKTAVKAKDTAHKNN